MGKQAIDAAVVDRLCPVQSYSTLLDVVEHSLPLGVMESLFRNRCNLFQY